MTASSLRISIVAVALGGCRAGLPPEPPGADPADPDAPIGRSVQTPSPFERSAFEGETLEEGGHDHGAHAGHGQPAKTKTEPTGQQHGGDDADDAHHHHGGHGGSP